MRVFGRDLIRGGHYGQRSCEPHLKGRTHGCTDQCCKREESSCQLGAVHTWHEAAQSQCGGMSAAGGRRNEIRALAERSGFDAIPTSAPLALSIWACMNPSATNGTAGLTA